jgi:hypothetical protein
MRRHVALVTAFATLTGCEFTLPGRPTDFPATIVEGSILLGGRPLPNGGAGWVTFFPEGSSLGDATVCRLKEDGSYICDRVPVGPLNVRIEVAPSVETDWPQSLRQGVAILRGPQSPLRIESKAGEKTRFDFDMARLLEPAPRRTF